MIKIDDLSIREKQAIGSICILNFCDKYGIKYHGVNELTKHLFDLLISTNLPEWNQKGLEINIVGRGDDFPIEFKRIIPNHLFNDTYTLFDKVIEIGIIDLFGETTNLPYTFLSDVLDIIKKHDVELKIPEQLFIFDKDKENGWGKPWKEDQYLSLINENNYPPPAGS